MEIQVKMNIYSMWVFQKQFTIHNSALLLFIILEVKFMDLTQYHNSAMFILKVTYHPLYSMNKFVTNKSKLPQDGAQVFPFMG